ncbi:MAG: outer membrane protein [Gammaproteobacteria bacterium]
MKRSFVVTVAALVSLASGSASADGAFTGRIGATAGNYEFNEEFVDQGCCGNPIGTTSTADHSSGQFGLAGGLGVSVARFFADVGLEALSFSKELDTDGDGIEDTAFYRSDFLLTLGVFLGDRWSVFGGFRHATFGDGLFSEDLGNTEDGPFIGGGVSFRAGKNVSLGLSAAYNLLTFSRDGQAFDDVDLNGVSVKAQMSFLGTPHGVYLRFQRFKAEESVASSFDYQYTEDYLNLGYQATFDFLSW